MTKSILNVLSGLPDVISAFSTLAAAAAAFYAAKIARDSAQIARESAEASKEQARLIAEQNRILNAQSHLIQDQLSVALTGHRKDYALARQKALEYCSERYERGQALRHQMSVEARKMYTRWQNGDLQEKSNVERALSFKLEAYMRDFWSLMSRQAELAVEGIVTNQDYYQWTKILLERLYAQDASDPIDYSADNESAEPNVTDEEFLKWVRGIRDRVPLLSYEKSLEIIVFGSRQPNGQSRGDGNHVPTEYTGTALLKIILSIRAEIASGTQYRSYSFDHLDQLLRTLADEHKASIARLLGLPNPPTTVPQIIPGSS